SGTSCESVVGATAGQRLPGAAYDAIRTGRREIVRGDLKAAHRAYCHAVGLDPGNITAIVELARVLLMRGDGASAVEWAKKGLSQSPNDVTLKSLLGDSLARVGDEDGARNAWLDSYGIKSTHDPEVRRLAIRDLGLASSAFE